MDQVEQRLLQEMKDAVGHDDELLLRRVQGGILRIGLTNRWTKPTYLRNPKAYCYVDQYRDAEDIVAACMLSSFVPGVTSTLTGSSTAIVNASKRMREMVELGFVKKTSYPDNIIGNSGVEESLPITLPPAAYKRGNPQRQESDLTANQQPRQNKHGFPDFVDGGLSNAFPVIDSRTVVVTPICGIYEPNPYIAPSRTSSAAGGGGGQVKDDNLLRISDRVKIYLNRQNAHTLRRIVLSSDDDALQERFANGHDDARRFLYDNNLAIVHSSVVNIDAKRMGPTKGAVVSQQ